MKTDIQDRWKRVKAYFNLLNDREDEQQVIEQVSAGVVFRGTNLWILMFAILIASLGLNVNSTAVIIGAMLVSPLMGPIIGMGLAVGIGDYDLLRRALKNYGVATLISIVTATVYFVISPLGEARSELLARTSPTLFDVLIAFCGGAAGVLALTTKSKGQVIPGVAIATALMPPLCTAGYGLATAQWSYFFGAFYLFFINTVFIALSTFLGVKLLRFTTRRTLTPEGQLRGRRLVWTVVVVTMLPAAVMTVNIVRKDIHERNVRQFVEKELTQPGTQILSTHLGHDTLSVVAVGRTISDTEIADARSRMDYYGLKGRRLEVIQGSGGEGLDVLMARINSISGAADAERKRMADQVGALQKRLDEYLALDTLSASVDAEARSLFPEVNHIAIGKLGGRLVAVADIDNGAMTHADRQRLTGWLGLRSGDADIDVIFR